MGSPLERGRGVSGEFYEEFPSVNNLLFKEKTLIYQETYS